MPKPKPVYYEAFALQDGTILLAAPTRKPVKTSVRRVVKIDEDGICQWIIEKTKDYDDMPKWACGTPFFTLANCLNTKRLLRSQVESKLEKLAAQMTALKGQLDRIEAAVRRT